MATCLAEAILKATEHVIAGKDHEPGQVIGITAFQFDGRIAANGLLDALVA